MSKSSTGLAPRLAAVQMLDAVLDDGRLLPEVLAGAVEKLRPEDRARAARLATSTLRWMDRADRILGPFLRQRPPTRGLNILRLGVVEFFVDGAAAHGVVNSAVELTRADAGTARMSGLVNAVLRKVTQLPPEKWDNLQAPQMPKWLRKQLILDYGKPVIAAMEIAQSKGAPLDLTVKSDAAGWAAKLNGTVLPTGTVRVSGKNQVTELEGFESGDWWVQDAAAALPVQLLDPQPDERILDICAAPGGKTMQMAAAGAKVTALDISETRMERVTENLSRTNLTAEISVADALEFETGGFDAILLDAPCSATGTIRRHPDMPYAKDSSGFQALFEQQLAMLDHALTLLKPGGRLVYCTCSLLVDEGEEQIKDLLERNETVKVDSAAFDHAGLPKEWHVAGGLRTRPDYWPDLGGMDGFFMTVLQKPA